MITLAERIDPAPPSTDRWGQVYDALPEHLSEILFLHRSGFSLEFIAKDRGITLLETCDRLLEAWSAVKTQLGTSKRAPWLEARMKRAGLWPVEAAPLSVDMAQVILRLPQPQKEAVCVRLVGTRCKDVPQVWGMKVATYQQRLARARQTLLLLAEFFGTLPMEREDCLRRWRVESALGLPSWRMSYVMNRAGVSWYTHQLYVGGYRPEDFPRLWEAEWQLRQEGLWDRFDLARYGTTMLRSGTRGRSSMTDKGGAS
jgi:hypothetical protein